LSALVWTGCTKSTAAKKPSATRQPSAAQPQPTSKPGIKLAPSAKPTAKPTPAAKAVPKPAPKPVAPTTVDVKAQRELYDLGLQRYTEERYAEAKVAWQQVIKLGPATSLAARARENIQKAERILQTLEEMRKQ